MKERIPIVMERRGEVVSIFPSMHKASRDLGLHVSTIKWRIERGTEIKGVLLRFVTESEKEKIREAALELIKEPHQKKATIEKSKNIKPKAEVKKLKRAERKDSAGLEEDDVELNSEKYSIVSYQMASRRVCITPCPFREAPKPKVGSCLCMDCPSFHGRNRSKQQVACSAINARILSKTKKRQQLTP